MWVIQLEDGTRHEYASEVRAAAEFTSYRWRGATMFYIKINEKSDKKNLINKQKICLTGE